MGFCCVFRGRVLLQHVKAVLKIMYISQLPKCMHACIHIYRDIHNTPYLYHDLQVESWSIFKAAVNSYPEVIKPL